MPDDWSFGRCSAERTDGSEAEWKSSVDISETESCSADIRDYLDSVTDLVRETFLSSPAVHRHLPLDTASCYVSA
jgi:hypothetical protein